MIQKENGKVKNSLLSIKDYLLFFILIAGSVTASFILFATFTDFRNSEGLSISAVLTFGNVMFITLICTAIYGVWRYFFIVKPVNRILEGTDKIRNGQFGETIPLIHKNANNYNEFDVIIDNLNIMSKELQGIETLRTDFISNVSHELKTPLASIQNYAALMQSEDLSEAERKEYSKTIMESAKHLTELITNILRLNKLENQTIYAKNQEFDLSEQVVQCILGFEDAWEENQINLETDIDENVHITADEELLSIVWNNLLSNALKFTPAHGNATVTVKQTEEQAVVTVCDSGIGMSEETAKHIFEKFYQGDTSHATKGNGLGLALVKRIVDIEHGTIAVNAAPNQGSTFTVTLPRKQ